MSVDTTAGRDLTRDQYRSVYRCVAEAGGGSPRRSGRSARHAVAKTRGAP